MSIIRKCDPDLVTVVIPAYAASKTLEKTVRSVINQTYPAFAIIVVVNGFDGTLKEAERIVELFAGSPIIVFPPEQNVLSASENWTRASLLSKSKYTKLLCADDTLESDALESQTHFLETNSDCDLVSSCRSVIDEQGKRVIKKLGGFLLKSKNTSRRLLLACTIRGSNVLGEPSAILFRTNVLHNNLPWSGINPYVLDLEMYLRVCKINNSKIGFIDRALCNFMVHDSSLSNQLINSQTKDFTNLIIKSWQKNNKNRIIVFFVSIPANVSHVLRIYFYSRI